MEGGERRCKEVGWRWGKEVKGSGVEMEGGGRRWGKARRWKEEEGGGERKGGEDGGKT